MNKTHFVGLLGLGTALLAACGSGEAGEAGDTGLLALLSTSDEAPGNNCPAGGKKLEYGTDGNSNGRSRNGIGCGVEPVDWKKSSQWPDSAKRGVVFATIWAG